MKAPWLKNNKVFIIAEAGVNHNGELNLAKKLVDVAVESGSDAVKFQTFLANSLLTPQAPLAKYQKRNTQVAVKNQYALIKSLELSFDDFRSLRDYCRQKRIMFLSTAFDESSVEYLNQLKMPIFKIPSGEVTNLPFLQFVARKNKWMILSTGMSDLKEVREAVNAIYRAGNRKLVLMHCVTEYPVNKEDLNLRAIQTLQQEFKVPVGFSDHSLGIDMATVAIVLGAQVIEKHFTLDKRMDGPDHKASLEPVELKNLVSNIRLLEKALGDGIKKPALCELKYRTIVRKSLTTCRNISKGDKIAFGDLLIRRPGNGILPKEMHRVIGRRARRSIAADCVLTWDMLK